MNIKFNIMKVYFSTLAIVLSIFFSQAQENESPEFIGENFSLEGALSLLSKSNSVEEFEKMINLEKNNVTNLDLNNDGEIDYVSVQDITQNDIHVLVLSVHLDENEKQDIATINIEKTGESEAIVQIEGDEDLYPANTIIEPLETEEKSDMNTKGPNFKITNINQVVVNVWFWPVVQFIYSPRYVIWISPYRWRHYPVWWKPWRPIKYLTFRSRNVHHKVYFRTVTTRRVTLARKVYLPNRRTSTIVVRNNRNTTVIKKNKRGKTVVRKKSRR